MVGKRRQIKGLVVSKKMDKTVSVEIEKISRHPLIGKRIRLKKRYLVHDEHNIAKEGDKVLILESRPISKLKRFVVVANLSRGNKNDTVKNKTGGSR